ncbi:MAG: oxidoreductase, partial [Candidatus Limnocylindrales bacterium]
MTSPVLPAIEPAEAPRRAPAWAAALAGLAAGAAALAAGELLAGLIGGAPSLVTAVGTLVIALQPAGAKELMVSLFGTSDKLALNLAVLLG